MCQRRSQKTKGSKYFHNHEDSVVCYERKGRSLSISDLEMPHPIASSLLHDHLRALGERTDITSDSPSSLLHS